MNKQYVRNGLEYNMQVEWDGGEEYEYRMLEGNKIDGLLPLRREYRNQKQYLVYTLSGWKPFWIISEKLWISGRQMYSLVDSLLQAAKEVKKYFLSPDNLVLEPDSLFLDMEHFRFHFLYVPGYEKNILGQLARLSKILLEKADRQDNESVLFAYGFYRILGEESVDFAELKQYVAQRGFYVQNPSNEMPMQDREAAKIEMPGENGKKTQKEIAKRGGGSGREERAEKGGRERQNSSRNCNGKETQQKRLPILFLVLFILWLIGAIGTAGIMYHIYYDGILEWKRNLLIILLIFTAILSILLLAVWRRGKQDEEAASIFLQPGEESSVWQEPDTGEQSKQLTTEQKKEREETSILSGSTVLLAQCGEPSGFPRLVFLQKASGQKFWAVEREREETGHVGIPCQDILLNHFPFLIGSSSRGVHYRLEDKAVSRFHASFSRLERGQELTAGGTVLLSVDGESGASEEVKYVLMDLNSTNGTFVNGRRLEPEEQREVRDGDQITFANIDFIFTRKSLEDSDIPE